MKILVTGGAGFIGSHLVAELINSHKDYTVVIVDKLSYCSDLTYLKSCQYAPNYIFIKGTLCDHKFVFSLFRQHIFDAVFHLAAESHVDNSYIDPLNIVNNNVMATHVLLEACRLFPVKKFLLVSTDEVYGGDHVLPVTEDAILNPTNPYSVSKAACEHLTNAYKSSYNIPILIVRLNNVYGPHQHVEKVIPRFIFSIINGSACTIHGNGEQRRHFLYVSDAINGILTVFERGKLNNTYNVGATYSLSILGLVEEIMNTTSIGSTLFSLDSSITFIPDRPHNDFYYPIDSSKIKSLGWEPLVSWEEGLKTTVEWYRNKFAKNCISKL